MAAMKQRVKNIKGSEYFPYPLYMLLFSMRGSVACPRTLQHEDGEDRDPTTSATTRKFEF